jgi:hypothetical protein
MKSIDQKSGDGEPFSDEALESALRSLPPVDVPVGLEGRLIEAIPRPLVVARPIRRSVWPGARAPHWLAIGTAAAIVVAATVVLALRGERDEGRLPNDSAGTRTPAEALAIYDIHSKEIDPCNILPPIPDWY